MMSCDASIGGYIISDICPVSCGSSPQDDPTGAYAGFGGCSTVIGTFGMACDAAFGGYTVSNVCMTSCESCGGGGPDGCDLPELSISLLNNGTVLYNSTSEIIAGFEFYVEGATVNSGSGGDAAASGMFIQASGSTVLAFSLTGGTIPAGCGTLVNLDLSGDATGLSGIVVSDPNAQPIYFEYYEGGDEGGDDITDGCDLPDSETTGYLHLVADGSVLYNTPEDIGGFQFTVDGASPTSASGGDAGAIGMMINANTTQVTSAQIRCRR